MTSSTGDLAQRLRPVVFRLYYLVRRESAQLLTLTQGSVLSELVGRGPSRMSRLSRLERVRMPSMTDVVRRLERLGMVTRRPDPDDGRAVLVEATPEGERFYAEMIAGREAELRALLERLDPAERAAIDAALPALTKLIADFHRDDPHSPETPELPKEELIRNER
ncbi:MarR family winged helix-turn-helix transcriptional regulator [Amycolatopsis sp. NPDC059090]|uniref:MarR family winged helix-turn-helix transcriptional regulator n=1 Tax=unclassified Amycolatopsis TaxID=2618356 RepID=UPI00366E3728